MEEEKKKAEEKKDDGRENGWPTIETYEILHLFIYV